MSDENVDEPVNPPDEAAAGATLEEPEEAETQDAADGAEAGEAPRDLGLLPDILEALVFVHRGILPAKTVREAIGDEFGVAEIEEGFRALRERYEGRGGAVRLLEVAGGWQLGTRPDLAEWIQRLDFYENHRHLSRPTLETLAIVAYKQPVTRVEIEAIRGVNCERIVRNLLERKLVKVLGHKDVPGRPMVLGTTPDFLLLFGLNSLADLPPLKDFVGQPAEELEEPVAPGLEAAEEEAEEGTAAGVAAAEAEDDEPPLEADEDDEG